MPGEAEEDEMSSTRNGLVAAGFAGTLALLIAAHGAFDRAAEAQSKQATQAPRFEVDPFWPKPLPNHWLLGSTIGVWVDAQDNVWEHYLNHPAPTQQQPP